MPTTARRPCRATGSGEYFIRAVAAHELARAGADRRRRRCRQALDGVLADIKALGGNGGLIAVSPTGEAAWGFTTPGMYRGMADADGRRVAIYADEVGAVGQRPPRPFELQPRSPRARRSRKSRDRAAEAGIGEEMGRAA